MDEEGGARLERGAENCGRAEYCGGAIGLADRMAGCDARGALTCGWA